MLINLLFNFDALHNLERQAAEGNRSREDLLNLWL